MAELGSQIAQLITKMALLVSKMAMLKSKMAKFLKAELLSERAQLTPKTVTFG